MKAAFSASQVYAMKELVGLPERLSKRVTPDISHAPISEVCQRLELPEPRYRDLLAADRWLAGGAVLRWLCSNAESADFDLFFPSIDAFNHTAHGLLSKGFSFRCFRALRTICQLCGRPGRLIRTEPIDDLTFPLPCIRCHICGDFGGHDSASLTPSRLLKMTPELIGASRMRALELLSPRCEIFHLSAVTFQPTPHEIISEFDFSVCHFALDDKNLYFSPSAWTDLLQSRVRIVTDCDPPTSIGRLLKYWRLGFVPYPTSVARLLFTQLRYTWRSGSRRSPAK